MPDSKQNNTSLFTEFDSVSTEEWENVLTRDLKGADYKEKLTWNSIEGIEALPFYRKEDLEKLPHINKGVDIQTPSNWQFCELIDRSDPTEANVMAKKAIESGADSLIFTITISPDEGNLGGDIAGIHLQNLDDLEILLDGIDLEKTGLVFDTGAGSVGVLGLMKAYLRNSAYGGPKLSFLYDPFTYMAYHGRLPVAEDEVDSIIGQMADETGFMTLAQMVPSITTVGLPSFRSWELRCLSGVSFSPAFLKINENRPPNSSGCTFQPDLFTFLKSQNSGRPDCSGTGFLMDMKL